MERRGSKLDTNVKGDSMTPDLPQRIQGLMMTLMFTKRDKEMILGIWSPCLLPWEEET